MSAEDVTTPGAIPGIEAVQRLGDYVLEFGGNEEAVMEDVTAVTDLLRELHQLKRDAEPTDWQQWAKDQLALGEATS